MFISELMQDIINAAEDKFGFQPHTNDGISIDIFYDRQKSGEYGAWQVRLVRPTKRTLNNGVIEDIGSCKITEDNLAFYTEGSTLKQALRDLQQKVWDATPEDWVQE